LSKIILKNSFLNKIKEMDTNNLRIAIIGAGNMGGAIARGLLKGKVVKTSNIFVSDISEANLAAVKSVAPEINTSTSNIEIIEKADIIILAVKPWLVETIASEFVSRLDYSKQIIVSIAAGVEIERLKEYFDESAIIFRLIPNTAIDVLQSASTVSAYNSNPELNKLIINIFSELGKVFFVPESQLNAFMSLSSCGIAYAFRYIRAVTEGGVEMGIYPNVAKEVVLQTLRGAVELLEATDGHPEAEIDKVTTPGGITIKGLNEMEANGFTNAVIKGLKA